MTTVYAVEVTSRCNLSCVYCPQNAKYERVFTRPRVDITDELFVAALAWATWNPPAEIVLAGMGEPLMHPRIADYVAMTRAALPKTAINLPTNGLLLTDGLARQLAPHHPRIFISAHVPARAAQAVQIADQYGILAAVGCDAVANPIDWAGQIDWFPAGSHYPCPFIRKQYVAVTSTGVIMTCCYDLTGESHLGHVTECPHALISRPWRCCPRCQQVP